MDDVAAFGHKEFFFILEFLFAVEADVKKHFNGLIFVPGIKVPIVSEVLMLCFGVVCSLLLSFKFFESLCLELIDELFILKLHF